MTDQDARGDAPRRDEPDRRRIISDFSAVIDIISRSMVRVLARDLAEDGLTVLQFHALRALASFGPELDMSSIGSSTGLPASTLTSIFDRLEERGLVERHHDARDRRRVVAALTPDGAALMRQLKEQELERLGLLLTNSSTGDLATTLEVFRAFHQRMREEYESRMPER